MNEKTLPADVLRTYNVAADNYNRRDFVKAAGAFFAAFQNASADPELQMVCAYARVLSLLRNGNEFKAEMLPPELRAHECEAMCAFVCHNLAANLRQQGHEAVVFSSGKEYRELEAKVGADQYVLKVLHYAFMGPHEIGVRLASGSGGRLMLVGRVQRRKVIDIWDPRVPKKENDAYAVHVFEQGLAGGLPIAHISGKFGLTSRTLPGSAA